MFSCKTRKYLAKLPNVSVIFIFFNEHFNTLLRSIYSVINRTPPELLRQIVLVDDGSEWEVLKKPLDDYVARHFPGLVDIVRNPERRGLIGARIAGAKVALGEVMVFFDSHIECNYNWVGFKIFSLIIYYLYYSFSAPSPPRTHCHQSQDLHLPHCGHNFAW